MGDTTKISKMQKSDIASEVRPDPKLQPIKLTPQMRREAPKPRRREEKRHKRDWKSSVFAAVIVSIIIGGMCAMLFWFPSYRVAQMFLPEVAQGDIESQLAFWEGRRAAEDIPRLHSISQLEDGTYDSLTYLTVEAGNIIPLGKYKLKDYADSLPSGSTGYARARGRRRPLSVYTDFVGPNAMYYGQYCVVELEDGSYIGAYLDSSYITAFGKVQLPIGRPAMPDSVEVDLLTEAAKEYSIPTDRLLMMHSERNYPQIKMLDHGIRITAIVLVPAVILGGWLIIFFIQRKSRHLSKVQG